MAVLKILIYITIILIPFGELLRFDLGDNISLKGIDIIIGISAVVWWIRYFIKREKNLKIPFLPQIIGFTLIAFISLIANFGWLKLNEISVAFLYLVRWLSYATLVFIVANLNKQTYKTIRILLIIAGGIFVSFGYAQYFLYPNLRNLYYLGWDDHLYRMFSTLFDPNFAGVFFVLYIFFLLGMLQKVIKSDKKQSVLLIILLVSTLLAVVLTYSRTALIMFIVSAVTYLLLLHKKKFVVLLMLFLIGLFIILSPKFYIENMNLLRVNSSKARITSASHAITIFTNSPVFGIGFNAYRYAQLRYGFSKELNNLRKHSEAGTDNSFLFVLATTGIIGFVSYLYLWFSIFKSIYARVMAKSIFSISVFSSLVGLFIGSLFLNVLFYPYIMLWVWILIGITENSSL